MTTVNKTKALRVATRCSTIDQFVATFHRFCDETSFFISTLGTRPVGLETPFSIQLEDGKPVLQGLCVVLEAYPTPANRYERPGVRLGLRRLTNDSVPIYKQLLAARTSGASPTIVDAKPPRADATPPPRPPPHPIVSRPLIETQKLVSPPAKADAAKIEYTPDAKADKTQPNAVSKDTKPLPSITRSYSELTSSKPLPAVAVSMAEPTPGTTTAGTSPSLVPLVPEDSKRRDATMPKFSNSNATRKPTPPMASRTVAGTPAVSRTTTPPIVSRTATPPAVSRTATPANAAPTTKPATPAASSPAATPSATPASSVLPTWAIKPSSSVTPSSMPPATSSTPTAPSMPPPTSSTAAAPPTSPATSSTATPRTTSTELERLFAAPATTPSDPPANRSFAAPATTPSDPTANHTVAAPTHELIVSRTVTPRPSELVVSRTVTPMPVIGRTTTATREAESIDGRTPGSELVLPANPLMNLTDESLEGFVDCTIYEETGNFFGAEDSVDGLQDLPIAMPRTRTASMAALAEPLELSPVTGATSAVSTPDAAEPSATSSSQLPTFAPFRQTSSLQPFAAPAAPSQPLGYPRTSTSDIPAVSRTVSGEIATQPSATPDYSAYPRTATGELPPMHPSASSYPYPTASPAASMRTATGEMPSYPRASPSDLPASYPQLSAPYPQVFPSTAPDASPVSWPAPNERTELSPNLRKRRMYLIGAIAILGATLIVMIIAAAVRGGDDDEATGKRAAAGVSTNGETDTPNSRAAGGDGSTKAGSAKSDASAKAGSAKPTDGSSKLAVGSKSADAPTKPGDGSTKVGSTTKSADNSKKAGSSTKPGDGSSKTGSTKPDTKTIAEAPHEADAGDDSAPAPNGLPVVGSGPCRLTVTTTPAGSIIQVDGNAAGPSPLTIANACQRARIDISHPRYQAQQRWVPLAADHPSTLDVTLSRPTHAVTVLTLPPGAEVLIDGRRAGTTPTIVPMMGFTSVDLTIEKSGYQTLTKRVYSKAAQDRVFVKLTKK